MLLFSSLVKSKSRKEATEIGSVVSEMVSSLGFGVDVRKKLLKSPITKRDKVINITIREIELSSKLSFAIFYELI